MRQHGAPLADRFNARGLDGLKEDVRTGRPPTYTAEQRSAVIAAALTRPRELGLPFALLDPGPRWSAYLNEQGIAMRRSRISEIFIREGLRWRQQETWFGARVDPDFARKRGRSNSSTPRRHRQRRRLPGRDGAAGGQELSRPAACPAGRTRPTGPAGDRLRPPRCCRLCLRRLPAGHRRGFHPSLRAPHQANWVDFLAQVEAWIDPASRRVYAIVDNLNAHSAPDVLLFCLAPSALGVRLPAQVRGLPEPDRAVVEDAALLALKGRRFETWAEIEQAVERATAYWNKHKHPFIWGRRRRHRTPRRFGLAAIPIVSRT